MRPTAKCFAIPAFENGNTSSREKKMIGWKSAKTAIGGEVVERQQFCSLLPSGVYN